MPQPLSSKEASLFRQVVKHYEAKQHKKGLKSAEQILRKTPNHGDTLAMKALLLNATGQTEEAFALAKVALTKDMKSHVCWHVYGLLWRSQKNFEEAIKAYKFALKLEPDSAQILRDLALLQVQMRDYQGYIQSRRQILQARPSLRQNWTAMAVAHHLAGELSAAENILKTYEDTLKNPPSKTDAEHSEATLYKNTVIAEGGDIERALTHLEELSATNLDRQAVMELRAEYLLRLDKKEEAEKAYRALIERNSDYRSYFEGLEKALGLDRSKKAELKEMYASVAEADERSDAARRIPLDFLEGDDFREAADQYLRKMLQKGVPSTFNNVKSLYQNEEKKKAIEDLVEGYASDKQTNGSTKEGANDDRPRRFEEAIYYFLAQHYNYKLSRDLKKAMQYTDKALEIAPKTYDYTMMKARIYKHLGNPAEAAKLMDIAREMDLKDRYINTKCAKYQLRNDDSDAAITTMSKFTRNEGVGGTLGDLLDMQVIWYLTEDGESNMRQGKTGLALKRFHTVYDIFETWQEDQFDFHSFSFRKGQIRSYVDMIRWEDRLREHPFYARAAINAVKLYVQIYDGQNAKSNMTNGVESVDDAEKRKAAKKAKKEQERQEREDAERREADKKAASRKATADADVKKPDPDPRGNKLLETKEPLVVATKFLQPLMEFGDNNSEAQHAGFDVYIRRHKFYLALKCLLTAFNIDPSDPIAHEQAIQFRSAMKDNPPTATPSIIKLAYAHLPALYKDVSTSPASINDTFLSKNPNSIRHRYSYLRTRQSLDPDTKEKNANDAVTALKECGAAELSDAIEGIRLLRGLGSWKKGKEEAFAKKAVELFPEGKMLIEREAERL